MDDPIEEFAYLWTTEREDWAVLRLDPDEAGLPFNRRSRNALLIDENDDLADAVVARMVAEGLPIITTVSE
jgi:hypothetical protein